MKMLADQEGWETHKRQAIKEGVDGVRHFFDSLSAAGALNYQRAHHVASLILAKKAIALGFPNGATQPQIISSYLFENDSFIKWGKSEIVGNGLQFVSVRVTKIRPSERIPEFPPSAKYMRKPGRPSKIALIDRAIESLARRNITIRNSASQKDFANIVLRETKRIQPKGEFPSIKTICARIRSRKDG
jgi:hypothetical protein